MRQLLFTIADTFEIEGRGLVVVPGIPEADTAFVKVGAQLDLVRPDRTTKSASVVDIETLSPYVAGRPFPILLGKIPKSEIPVGTEVWWLKD